MLGEAAILDILLTPAGQRGEERRRECGTDPERGKRGEERGGKQRISHISEAALDGCLGCLCNPIKCA